MTFRMPVLAAAAVLSVSAAQAATINNGPLGATNLDVIDLGEVIVGPLGPSVNSSFVVDDPNTPGFNPLQPQVSIGDFQGSVFCEAGADACPGDGDGLFRYVQTVTPGADVAPDNAGFSIIGTAGIDDATITSTGFLPSGFTGVAGYSFADADAADVDFNVSVVDGGLLWETEGEGTWDRGETVSFFYESTRAPAGPDGFYLLGAGSDLIGVAVGPIPEEGGPTVVPVPASLPLLLAGLGTVGILRRRQR